MPDRRSRFQQALSERQTDPANRRWLFVPYDQLTCRVGPLAREDPSQLGIMVVENPWKVSLRPYHQQKIALVMANLRHFALEQAERGVAVRHIVGVGPYRQILRRAVEELCITTPLRVMRPAERELRVDLAPLESHGVLEVVPHEGWLTTRDQFERSQDRPAWRMNAFYRLVRRESGILMDGSRPEGGKFSFDVENRKPWKGSPPAPPAPTFPSDPIKDEVVDLVLERFARHPGTVDREALPATLADAHELRTRAVDLCLPWFGPYEDAMSTRSTGLFHTRLSALMNILRILPSELVDTVASLDAPLASREGFVRQVLGWREFVHHVHDVSDGFRRLGGKTASVAPRPGDGGYSRWLGQGWNCEETRPGEFDGGSIPSHLDAVRPVPIAFWGQASGLTCLDRVIEDVWREAYGHHITRLMVLSNLAMLLDLAPREVTDWFWCAYADAYEWVVEPNVLAMGTFAVGELMTTKPYVSGAAYIDRMSDYCASCAFNPRSDCPITSLYWAFFERHRDRLAANPRLRIPFASLKKRSAKQRELDAAVFEWVSGTLARGDTLKPSSKPSIT